MKQTLLTAGLLLSSLTMQAQAVEDSVTLGAGYANQSYYSLADGEMENVNNNNWDLAFDASAFGATVRLNRRICNVYLYPGDTTDWATVDTTGHMSWDTYVNGYTSWSEGALNMPADPDEATDLGWGVYSPITHHTTGNRIFVIAMEDGAAYKKVWIKKLASGTYTFMHANLDNSEEETVTLAKADYSTKNFAYYSLATAETIDREPASSSWDIVFTNYVDALAPGVYYGVTGALTNVSTTVYRAADVPVADADYTTGSFETNISEIGYNWKTFNMPTFSYIIEDSLCYFIETQAGDVWKLVFTGFNGSVDGKIYFTKEQIEVASLAEYVAEQLSIYPNPANNQVTVATNNQEVTTVRLYNQNGQLVREENEIYQNVVFEVTDLPNGLYLVNSINTSGESTVEKLMIAH